MQLQCLMLCTLILFITVGANKVPAVIVFGDSSVDAGNNNHIFTVLKSNFPPYGRDFMGGQATGRFSNGRIPPDFISEAFGLKPLVPAYLDPNYNISDFATGVCFASAGTGYDSATSDVLSVIPLWKEVDYFKQYRTTLKGYLGDEKSNKIIQEALYLISLGTNDFLENYYTLFKRRLEYNVDKYEDFLLEIAEEFIKQVYGLGARKMSITGVPPMGCLPLERSTNALAGFGDSCIESYNNVSRSFNAKLSGLVKKLNQELPGVQIISADAYSIFHRIIRRPSLYGFEYSDVACCSTGYYEMSYLCNQFNPYTCEDANKYVFWDAFHPSERTNQILADYVLKHYLHVFM
ncbi:GDSL esterase/lipase [Heracleum sosnowskyi]|uniref:GDSL esterase/lipase n=1 Tax=Heracleum sosnowskyi TaxID=360622 RepID=A0AAD8GT26_9APIA|nr:GDSL esterase/lipase [Heracleum sosnowskyi]